MSRSSVALLFVVSALTLGGCGGGEVTGIDNVEDPGPARAPTGQSSSSVGVYLANGGLEQDTAWYFSAPSGYTAGYATDQARTGSRSIKLASTAHGGPGVFAFAGQSQEVGDLTGKKVVLTARIRLEDVQGQGVSIALRGDDPSREWGSAEIFSTTQGRIDISGTADWTEYTVELEGFDSSIGILTAYVVLTSETTGSVWVDDIELDMGIEEPVLELMNGGFEDGDLRPDYWWKGGPGHSGFVLTYENGLAWEGSRFVSIARSSATAGDFAFWAQTIRSDLLVGGAVTLSVRIRSELTGEGVSIVIRGDDTTKPSGYSEAFATTQGSVSITGTTDWTVHRVRLDHLPPNIKSVTVYLVYLPETTGYVAFDGVELTGS